MNYNIIYKSIKKFHIVMGIYGFSRGFRCEYDESFCRSITQDLSKRKSLFSERLLEGIINSTIYISPLWNMYPIFCLLNRIEISFKGLKKEDYKHYYKEPFSGYCFDTL